MVISFSGITFIKKVKNLIWIDFFCYFIVTIFIAQRYLPCIYCFYSGVDTSTLNFCAKLTTHNSTCRTKYHSTRKSTICINTTAVYFTTVDFG